VITEYFAGKKISDDESIRRLYSSSRYTDYSIQCDQQKLLQFEEEIVDDLNNGKEFYAYVWSNTTEKEKFLLFDYAQDGLINYKNTKEIIELLKRGIFIIEDERLRIFSPGFRAYILTSIDKDEINAIQKKCRENSTWHYVRVPLLLFLFGIAAVLFDEFHERNLLSDVSLGLVKALQEKIRRPAILGQALANDVVILKLLEYPLAL